jgi:hypothetical protein
VPEVLDAAASGGRAATDSEEKTMEAPCSAPSRLSFSNLLLHLGDLAVDTFQVEAEGAAAGLGEGQVWDSIEQSAGG